MSDKTTALVTAISEKAELSREAAGSLLLLDGMLKHTCPEPERERVVGLLLAMVTGGDVAVLNRPKVLRDV